MKVLVLATDYPNKLNVASLYYIHARNLYYKSQSIDVTVINFMSDKDYIVDDIAVITLGTFEKSCNNIDFDLLICHAPNLRNHLIFLKKYERKFEKMVFFFHGHEVLMNNKVYPKPYSYLKKESTYKVAIQNLYDWFKLRVWNYYYQKNAHKSHFIFVSNWMKEQFLMWTKIPQYVIENRNSITYNCVSSIYETKSYDYTSTKEYDFITIRSVLDGSKYCIDLVCRLAEKNPDLSFLLIGKGDYFNYNKKPNNVTWVEKRLNHNEIVEYLDKSKCALMLTRVDAQGLMACEMATYGIPLITSDIPVCHEIFSSFNNVRFIDNSNLVNESFTESFKILWDNVPYKKCEKYFNENTSKQEVDIFKGIMNEELLK